MNWLAIYLRVVESWVSTPTVSRHSFGELPTAETGFCSTDI